MPSLVLHFFSAIPHVDLHRIQGFADESAGWRYKRRTLAAGGGGAENVIQDSPGSNHLVQTGIEGLDTVLLGGLRRGGFYLVQGDPGSGKTTLALQFAQTRARLGDRCLYLSLTESRRDLENSCASHGWSLDGLEVRDLTRGSALSGERNHPSVFHPADTELSDMMNIVARDAETIKPQTVVLDGMSELRLLSGDPLRYRRQLIGMKQYFEAQGATVLVLDDRSASFPDFTAESLMGGNIVLERFLPNYGRARRRLYVTKLRGANFREGSHEYDIVTGGLVVHPRRVADGRPVRP